MRRFNLLDTIKWLCVGAFAVYLFIYFKHSVQPILIYHLQQPPFYFMQIFFSQFTDYPGGLAEYLGNFFAQLLHSNTWGSLLLVLSILLQMLIAKYIFRHHISASKGFLWMILPVFPLIVLFQNYFFPYYIFLKIFLAYLSLAILILLKKYPKFQISLFIVLFFLLYYLAGSTALLVFLGSAIFYFLFNPLYPVKTKIFYVVLSAIAAFAVPYLGFKFLFNIPYEKTWWDIIPTLPIVIRYNPDKYFYAWILLLPSILLILGIAKLVIQKFAWFKRSADAIARYRPFFAYVNVALVAVATYFLLQFWFFPQLNNQKKNVLLVDYYTSCGNWDKAISTALSTSEYDLFINYNYNRAVYNAGKLGEWFFRYPQLLGSDGLYPDKITSGQIALVASDYYYEMGYISEALHWAYEAQSTTPYNPRVLQRLVKVHLIESRPEAAATYLQILKTAFFQNDFVKKYSAYVNDTSLIAKDPEFQEKRSLMPLNTNTPGSINQKLKLLLQFNKNNRRALEFLAMHYLMSHQLGDFVNILPSIMRYYGQKLPVIYQEALLLYMAKTGAQIQFPFSNDVVLSTKQFFEILRNNPDRKVAQNTLAQFYKGSYLFYVTFQSPLITGMKLKAREVEPY